MKGFRNKSYRQPKYLVISLTLSLLALSQGSTLAQGTPPAANGASTAGGTYTPNPKAVAMYNLGLTAHKQGSPESAIIFFKRACDIDPNLADAQYNLGVLYQMQKRFKEAQPHFEEVLRIKPTDPDAHFQLGIIFQDTGRAQEARQQLSAIAPSSSHFSDAQRRLAQINNMPAQSMQSQPAQQNYQQPNSVQQQSAPLRDPALAEIPSSTDSAPAQVQGQDTPPLSGTRPGGIQSSFQQLPPQVYTPPGAAQAPTSTGPVPVLPNSTLRVIATGFSAPSGLAFDRNGNLYVANYMTNSIDRIGSDGSRNTFCTGVNLRGPIGLVVDESNNLYVANYNSGNVVRVSPAGISTVIASGFKKPYYLTLDKDGNLYVSQQEDNSIVRMVLPRAVGSRSQ